MKQTLSWLFVLALGAALSAAQEDEDADLLGGRVNYAWAHTGTGFFSIGRQSAQVARIPFGYRLRSVDDDGFGLKLKLPLSLGAHEFTVQDVVGRDVVARVETVTLALRLEFELPMRENWWLKPYAELGFGKRISADEEALLYAGGTKILWLSPRQGLDLRLGGALKFEGFELLEGAIRDSYGVAEAGTELRWPAGFDVQGKGADFGVYLIARRFLPEVEVIPSMSASVGIRGQMEIGLTFGTWPSLSIWGIQVPRLGLAHRWGDGLSSYRLNFGFPF